MLRTASINISEIFFYNLGRGSRKTLNFFADFCLFFVKKRSIWNTSDRKRRIWNTFKNENFSAKKDGFGTLLRKKDGYGTFADLEHMPMWNIFGKVFQIGMCSKSACVPDRHVFQIEASRANWPRSTKRPGWSQLNLICPQSNLYEI